MEAQSLDNGYCGSRNLDDLLYVLTVRCRVMRGILQSLQQSTEGLMVLTAKIRLRAWRIEELTEAIIFDEGVYRRHQTTNRNGGG